MADPDYHAAKRQGYEWGVKEERERIIALLNAKFTEHKESGQKDDAWLWGFYAAIACIFLDRGENE